MRGRQLFGVGITQASTKNVIPSAVPNASAMIDRMPAIVHSSSVFQNLGVTFPRNRSDRASQETSSKREERRSGFMNETGTSQYFFPRSL